MQQLSYIMLKNSNGDVAQIGERSLSMREVRGSIPRISMNQILFSFLVPSLSGELFAVCAVGLW